MSYKYLEINNFANPFIIILIIAFIPCLFCSGYYSLNRFYETIWCSIPLFYLFILWSAKTWILFKEEERNSSKNNMFKIDLFLFTYSFYVSGLLVIIVNFNNVDVQGWWVVGVLFNTIIGFIFALVYSVFGLLLKPHRLYSYIYSTVFFVILNLLNFFPNYITINILGTLDIFWLIYLIALLGHIAIITVVRNHFN